MPGDYTIYNIQYNSYIRSTIQSLKEHKPMWYYIIVIEYSSVEKSQTPLW